MKTEKERMHFSARVAGIDYDAAEVRITSLLIAQRDRFEQAYALETGGNVKELAKWHLSEGVGYKPISPPLLYGAWIGWQMRERLSGHDPFMGFILDAANAGEMAAYDEGCKGMMCALEDVLNSMERGGGVSYQPWERLKGRVYDLKEKAARYDWLKAQTGLELRTDGSTWKRLDGTPFRASHFLASGGTQFSPQDSLDATIDCARTVQNARGR